MTDHSLVRPGRVRFRYDMEENPALVSIAEWVPYFVTLVHQPLIPSISQVIIVVIHWARLSKYLIIHGDKGEVENPALVSIAEWVPY